MSRPYDEYAEYDEYNRRRRPEERRPSRHSDGYGRRSPDRELRYQERYYDDRRYPPPAPRAYDSERRYDDRGYGHQHHEYHSPAFDRERYGRHDATPSRPQATPSRPPQAPQVGHPTPHQAYRGPRDNEKARLDGLERQKTVLKTAFPNHLKYLDLAHEGDPFAKQPDEIAVVFSRASSKTLDPADLERSALSSQWLMDGAKGHYFRSSFGCTIVYVHMDDKASILAMPIVGNEKKEGKFSELGPALDEINKGAVVHLIVRSWAGLTTSYDSLVSWLQNLIEVKQPSELTLHLHEMKREPYPFKSGLALAKFAIPIHHGRCGWSLDLPMDDLVSAKPLAFDGVCSALRRFFAELNALKESRDAGEACPKNRNIFRLDDREAVMEERLFGSAV